MLIADLRMQLSTATDWSAPSNAGHSDHRRPPEAPTFVVVQRSHGEVIDQQHIVRAMLSSSLPDCRRLALDQVAEELGRGSIQHAVAVTAPFCANACAIHVLPIRLTVNRIEVLITHCELVSPRIFKDPSARIAVVDVFHAGSDESFDFFKRRVSAGSRATSVAVDQHTEALFEVEAASSALRVALICFAIPVSAARGACPECLV